VNFVVSEVEHFLQRHDKQKMNQQQLAITIDAILKSADVASLKQLISNYNNDAQLLFSSLFHYCDATSGNTALHYAVMVPATFEFYSLVADIFVKQFKVQQQQKQQQQDYVNKYNNLGFTALLLACDRTSHAPNNDTIKIVEHLCEQLQASTSNKPTLYEYNTPLHLAIKNSNLELTKYLAIFANNNSGSNMIFDYCNKQGETVFDLAMEQYLSNNNSNSNNQQNQQYLHVISYSLPPPFTLAILVKLIQGLHYDRLVKYMNIISGNYLKQQQQAISNSNTSNNIGYGIVNSIYNNSGNISSGNNNTMGYTILDHSIVVLVQEIEKQQQLQVNNTCSSNIDKAIKIVKLLVEEYNGRIVLANRGIAMLVAIHCSKCDDENGNDDTSITSTILQYLSKRINSNNNSNTNSNKNNTSIGLDYGNIISIVIEYLLVILVQENNNNSSNNQQQQLQQLQVLPIVKIVKCIELYFPIDNNNSTTSMYSMILYGILVLVLQNKYTINSNTSSIIYSSILQRSIQQVMTIGIVNIFEPFIITSNNNSNNKSLCEMWINSDTNYNSNSSSYGVFSSSVTSNTSNSVYYNCLKTIITMGTDPIIIKAIINKQQQQQLQEKVTSNELMITKYNEQVQTILNTSINKLLLLVQSQNGRSSNSYYNYSNKNKTSNTSISITTRLVQWLINTRIAIPITSMYLQVQNNNSIVIGNNSNNSGIANSEGMINVILVSNNSSNSSSNNYNSSNSSNDKKKNSGRKVVIEEHEQGSKIKRINIKNIIVTMNSKGGNYINDNSSNNSSIRNELSSSSSQLQQDSISSGTMYKIESQQLSQQQQQQLYNYYFNNGYNYSSYYNTPSNFNDLLNTSVKQIKAPMVVSNNNNNGNQQVSIEYQLIAATQQAAMRALEREAQRVFPKMKFMWNIITTSKSSKSGETVITREVFDWDSLQDDQTIAVIEAIPCCNTIQLHTANNKWWTSTFADMTVVLKK